MRLRPRDTAQPALTDEEAREERARAGHAQSPLSTRPPLDPSHAFDELTKLAKELKVGYLPEWDILGPYTIGGTTPASAGAVYRRDNPFQTTCEFCVVGFTFTAAGSLWLSRNAMNTAPGNAVIYDQQNALDGIAIEANVATTIPGLEIWYPLPQSGSVFVFPTVGAGAAYAILAFRRRRNKQAVYYE